MVQYARIGLSMSNRIDLSAHTHIEDMDGVRYLVTTSRGVAVEWMGLSDYRLGHHGRWARLGASVASLVATSIREWRIPLTAVAPVYAYSKGEMWAASFGDFIRCGSAVSMALGYDHVLHRRSAAVCDSGKTFRLFHEELKEARR